MSADEEELARVLDATGTVAAAAVWLRWLYHDGKEFEDRAAAGRRLEEIVGRMERWPLQHDLPNQSCKLYPQPFRHAPPRRPRP